MATEQELEAMVVRLFGDTSDYQKSMEEAEETTASVAASIEEFGGKIESIGGMMAGVGKKMTVAVTVPLLAMKTFSLAAFSVQEKAEVTLRGLMDALGRPADLFDKYKNFAGELQKITTTGDETTLEMLKVAEALGVTGDAAQTAVKEAMGLGAAIGMNAKSAIRYTAMLAQGDTMMLNRYLPALRQIEDQSERVRVAHDSLAKMFSVAEAEAETFSGMLTRMWNEFGDLAEVIGGVMAEDLKPFLEWLKDTFEWLKAMNPATARLAVIIGGVAAAAGPVLIFLGTAVTMLGAFVAALPFVAAGLAAIPGLFLAWAPAIIFVAAAIGGAIALVIIFRDQIGNLVEWAKGKWGELTEHFAEAIEGVTNALKAGDIQLAFEIVWAEIRLTFFKGIKPLRVAWAELSFFFQDTVADMVHGVVETFSGMFTTLLKGVVRVQGWLKGWSKLELNVALIGVDALVLSMKGTAKEVEEAIRERALKGMTEGIESAQGDIDRLLAERKQLTQKAEDEAEAAEKKTEEETPTETEAPQEVQRKFEALQAGAVQTIGRGSLQETILAQESRLAFVERGPTREQEDSKNVAATATNTERAADTLERLEGLLEVEEPLEAAGFKG